MEVLNKIRKLLDENHVDYKFAEHEPTITSEDAARIRGVDLSTGAKAMVLKSKNNFYLAVLPGNKRINYRVLKNHLGTKDLSLAKEEEVFQLTGLVKGSVPPFGNILGLKMFMDPLLLENEYINFNAGSISHSIQMKSEDLVRIVIPELISFTE